MQPLLLHYRKSFAFPGLPAGLAVEADAALAWHETTVGFPLPLGTEPWGEIPEGSKGQGEGAQHGPRVFSTAITQTGPRHIIARLPGSGAIAARGTINGYDVGFADRTDDTAIYDFLPDGTGIYRFTIVATGLPAGFRIHLRTHYQGATFANGSRDLILTAADFDANGIATMMRP